MASRQRAERCWKSRVDRGLHQDLDDLVPADTKVGGGADVIAQLRNGGAQRGE
jgi:hypothetical protein